MNESEIVSLIKENLFDIFYEFNEYFPCEKCGKLFNVDNLNAHEPYLNYCNPCIKEEEIKEECKIILIH